MENNASGAKKRENKLDSIFLAILTGLLLTILGQMAGLPIMACGDRIADEQPGIYTICSYACFIGIWIVVLAFMALYKPDRPLLRKLLPGGSNTLKKFLAGIAAGFATNGICVLVSALRGDIHLYFSPDNILLIVLCFFAVLIQSSAEELVCRHYIQRHLARRYKTPVVSILIPSLVFSFLHVRNPGVTPLSLANIAVIGVVYSLAVYYFDSFWMVAAMHAMWNYTQNIIFGLPNSGLVMPLSVCKLDASTAVDSFSYNVSFGVEGTVLALLINLALGAVIVVLGRKQKAAELQALDESNEI